MWQNLEAKNKYFPMGTNVLLVTVIGEYLHGKDEGAGIERLSVVVFRLKGQPHDLNICLQAVFCQ
jgi:hypothetical protein